jgi:hypothetical protein
MLAHEINVLLVPTAALIGEPHPPVLPVALSTLYHQCYRS